MKVPKCCHIDQSKNLKETNTVNGSFHNVGNLTIFIKNCLSFANFNANANKNATVNTFV